jgi:ankyrin repeat protein
MGNGNYELKNEVIAMRYSVALSVILLLGYCSTSLAGTNDVSNEHGVIEPMMITGAIEPSSAILDMALKDNQSEEDRYTAVTGFVEKYGEWVTLNGSDSSPKVHISSYLLLTKNGDLATALLRNNVYKGWLAYRFMDGVASDFVFALQNNEAGYLKELFRLAPSGLNTAFPIQLEGENVLPLSLLATNEYVKSPFYDEILLSMLENGANPHQKMSTELTPMIVASSSNNMRFVRIVQTHNSGQARTLTGLLSNTPMDNAEMIEMQAIADTFMEQSKEKKASYRLDKLHELWVQMILKGYNLPADLMYEELIGRSGFNINSPTSGGLTAMMAAVMSPLYGGNVEYAKLLIKRGVSPKTMIEIPVNNDEKTLLSVNYIQLALQGDNFKIVALMIANNVNFISLPEDESVLILAEALEQKSYISAAIIKEALLYAVAQKASSKE